MLIRVSKLHIFIFYCFLTEKRLREEGDGVTIPSGWKDTFSKEENKGGVMGKSNFVILFPKYREAYLKESWPVVESLLSKQVFYCGFCTSIQMT